MFGWKKQMQERVQVLSRSTDWNYDRIDRLKQRVELLEAGCARDTVRHSSNVICDECGRVKLRGECLPWHSRAYNSPCFLCYACLRGRRIEERRAGGDRRGAGKRKSD